jgi:radical SAM superfamily enzyme YgiQ (UPF0313 family)
MDADARERPIDLHVIFPPQWSPFQPFLSTPSLKAYLEGRGHRVRQEDWNVGFYDHFIGHSRLPWARKRLARYIDELGDEHERYRARAVHALVILRNYKQHRDNVRRLRDPALLDDVEAFRRSVISFQSLLDAFSIAEPVIELGTSSFSSGDVMASFASLLSFLENGTDNPFIAYFEARTATLAPPRYFGISIIGQEQIVPGLTLGRILKQRFPDVPVVVGGSVFSRLVEKDSEVACLFGRCFDYVCRYEGEQPMDAFLASPDPKAARTPNLAFLEEDKLVLTDTVEPLGMAELPTPDFADLPLEDYLTPHIVLPLLTTRGCYWGKCAFCYHGMIYQDRYRMRAPEQIAKDVAILEERHGARHFAFNDEALPPKMFRLLPDAVPPGRYFFTGLYKFEKYFRPEDFQRMYEAGFRSLYIGLESASERVQRQMQKRNLQSTMRANLKDAHDAGIWNHTFNFFGFPTETEEEAQVTADFLLDHADIIHSEGTGTFSFEHNAPIHHDPDRYGVAGVEEMPGRVLQLYYNYRPKSGIDADQAQAALARFNASKNARGLYQTGRWIPREYLLVLLSHHSRAHLKAELRRVERPQAPELVSDALEWFSSDPVGERPQRHYIVNKLRHQVFETNADAVALLALSDSEMAVSELVRNFPAYGPLVAA